VERYEGADIKLCSLEEGSMEMQSNLIDLNTAERVELRNVPGIGAKLADRIIAARPFYDLMDLKQVSGVGPALFEQLKTWVTVIPPARSLPPAEAEPFSTSPEDQPVLSGAPTMEGSQTEPEEAIIPEQPSQEAADFALEGQEIPGGTSQPLTDEAMHESGITESNEAAPESNVTESPASEVSEPVQPAIAPPAPPESPAITTPGQPAPGGISRPELYGVAAASGALSFILAVLFTLLFLGFINGGLLFAKPVEINRLASQVNTIDTQAKELSGEIDSLNSRLSAVEGLDGRVTSLEQDARQLRNDVDALSGSAAALGKRIDDLSFNVDGLITRTGRFQNFLDGLRNLLNNLNQLEVK
jgi:outer membrane murein-binding lipoprotein Lpp